VAYDSNTRKVPEKEGHAKIMKIYELAEENSRQKMQTTA
jgi:hypothetical protein